jgi:molecular chaperone DnaJ
MIVEAQVQTPTKLSKEQKELLRQFEALEKEQADEGFFSRLFHGQLGKHKKKRDESEKVANG